jgi:RNA polymerase sigma-70 factor (ECF subfamily)
MPDNISAQRPKEKQRIIETFYSRYKAALKGYFLRRVHNHAEADDLTQELLVRVTQQVDREEIDNPDAFVFKVAANLLRSKGREWQRNAKYGDQLEQLVKSVEVLSPERVLVHRQSLARLLKHLDSLNPRVREVLFLHRLEGMKYAEIALIHGISVSTVEKDISKAIAHLARCAAELRDE